MAHTELDDLRSKEESWDDKLGTMTRLAQVVQVADNAAELDSSDERTELADGRRRSWGIALDVVSVDRSVGDLAGIASGDTVQKSRHCAKILGVMSVGEVSLSLSKCDCRCID